jgi:hypothetical protein
MPVRMAQKRCIFFAHVWRTLFQGAAIISSQTMRNSITEIFSELQVVDRAQAIIRACDVGLGGEATRDTKVYGF